MSYKFCVYGNPISHTKSPNMHNFALKSLGIDGVYDKKQVQSAQELIEHIKTNSIKGANITVPFKEDVIELLDSVDEFAKSCGAVNTIVNKNGELGGYNTDAQGFYLSLPNSYKSALILGAGGSAKAITLYLKQKKVDVCVLNRSERNREFFEKIGVEFFSEGEFYPREFELVVNSTSAGLSSKEAPFKEILEKILPSSKLGYDLLYGLQTPFLELCERLDIKRQDGKYMLINQGVLAFNLFFDSRYSFDSLQPLFAKGFDS
ncbi:MAG: shikimate dehydrogenase [Campylobacterales bacterium]